MELRNRQGPYWIPAKTAVRKIESHAASLGIPMAQLLMKAGVYQSNFYRWKRGRSRMVHVAEVEKILAVEAP